MSRSETISYDMHVIVSADIQFFESLAHERRLRPIVDLDRRREKFKEDAEAEEDIYVEIEESQDTFVSENEDDIIRDGINNGKTMHMILRENSNSFIQTRKKALVGESASRDRSSSTWPLVECREVASRILSTLLSTFQCDVLRVLRSWHSVLCNTSVRSE
jgi:hypothetical protein